MKYEVLEWNRHIAWFDPRFDAQAVLSEFVNGEWRFSDWRNGAFVPSKSVRKPRPTIEFKDLYNGERQYLNQVKKHFSIDAFLQAEMFNVPFQIVLNLGEERDHYQTRIKACLEMTLPEIWEQEVGFAETAKLKSTFAGTLPKQERQAVENHTAFCTQLAQLTKQATIVARTPMGRLEIAFDPINAAKVIEKVQASSPAIEYTIQ
jgi:hypothetical protein